MPLVLFLLAVLMFVLRDRVRKPVDMAYGISLAVVGMIIFNLGLTYGLAKLGGQSGGLMYMSRLDAYVPLILPEDVPVARTKPPTIRR